MVEGGRKLADIEEHISLCRDVIWESVLRFSIFSYKRQLILKAEKNQKYQFSMSFDAKDTYDHGIVRLMSLLGAGDWESTKSLKNLLKMLEKSENISNELKEEAEEILNSVEVVWLDSENELKVNRDKSIVHLERTELGWGGNDLENITDSWPYLKGEVRRLLSDCMRFYDFLSSISRELNLKIEFPVLSQAFEEGVTIAHMNLCRGRKPRRKLIHSVISGSPIIGEPYRYTKSTENSMNPSVSRVGSH